MPPPNRRYREGFTQFRKYNRRFEKLKSRLERKLAAGTFYRLPPGTRRYLIRRYHALKAKLERLRVLLLKLGGIAALSLAFAASQTYANAPNPLELSSLDGSNGFVINGIDSFDESGRSVSSGGDVNGDGFDDLIVGAYRADPGAISGAGESYVIFGRAGGFAASLGLSSLNGSNGFVSNGVASINYSGRSLSSAGDVNGDGFDDLVIGAIFAGPGYSRAGESYVVFGQAGGLGTSLELSSLDGNNGFVIRGIDVDDFSGSSVSSARDVNGDGFDDLIIGARGADPGANSRAGESYVVFGQADGFGANLELSSLDGSNGFVIRGIDVDDYSAYSVSSAGDINGDGFDDLIIGAWGADPGGKIRAGESYVVFGKEGGFEASLGLSSIDGSNGFVINGIDFSDFSGFSVSCAGDVNADGFDDLIIGAWQANPGGNIDAGESYVVFGKAGGFGASLELSSLDGSNGFVINGIEHNDYSGHSVSSAGDMNGDGFDDVIIGAFGAEPGGVFREGESYVLFGKAGGFGPNLELSSIDGSNGFVINGIDWDDLSGFSVSCAGDVNGDGFDDVIIGAFGADPGGNDLAGESYVIFGGNFTGGAETQVGDETDNTLTGTASDDVLIGTQGSDTLVGAGGADVLRGGEGDDVLAISDLNFRRIVGGNGMDTLRLDGSGITLDLTTIADNRITGVELIDIRGSSPNTMILDQQEVLNLSNESNTLMVLASADDTVNIGSGWTLDGLLSVGGTLFSVYRQGAATLMVAGKLQLSDLLTGDGRVGFVISGINIYDGSGDSVSSAGDVNGDGFDDLIVGAPFANSATGESYVVFGNATGFGANLELSSLNGSNGFTITGIDSYDQSGRSVSGTGDLNGDGFDDLIIGAYAAEPGNNNTRPGESYVLFGKANGFSTNLALSSLNGSNGVDSGDNSGRSVSNAGDINGDGFDDFIIGAPFAGPSYGDPDGNVRSGESYVVFGNPNGFGTNLELSDLDGTNGFVISGIDKSDSSGRSVSSAGDINGDGFDDLIIGGVLADNGDDQSVGESYVVFGKAGGFGANLELSSLDGSNGFVMIGIDAFDHSGTSVSSAGDVNGDGFDDLIIGSVGANPNGNFDAGESYVVFGKASGFAARLELSSLGAPNGFVINGIDADDDSGYSVSGAGDVNGDGFDDLIIGAKSADPGGINSGDGESYVVFGKAGSFGASLELSSLDGTNGFVINGINAFDRSGASVSSAGDVNGDGFDDLIIGASRADPNGNSSAGESYVIFGGNFTGGAETLVGDEADNLLAGSVGGDVLIGAQGDDTLAGGGGADVLRGGAGNDTLAVSDTDFRRLVGGNGLDTLRVDGSDIELDLTGDLRNRLTGIELIDLKGAGSNSLIIDKAAVLNLSRESNMLTVLATADDSIEIGVGWTFDGLHSMGGILFSSYIQGAAKVMIGGRVHVADLAVGDGSVGSLATAISGGDFFAYAVSAAGDVNGDGFDDLIIGAPNADPGSAPEAGVTYVVFGRPDGFGTNMDISTLGGSNGFAIHGIDAYDISGLSVSGAGDVNGDGFDDIIIGAPQADFESNSLAGECYVVFGKADGFQATFQLSDLDGSSGFIIDDLGGIGGQLLGWSVSGAGDLNGDGFDDVIVGSLFSSDRKTQIVFGKEGGFDANIQLTSLDGDNGFVIDGTLPTHGRASSVSDAGDVNGDGFDDLIIGAPFSEPTGIDGVGSSFVVLGHGSEFGADLLLHQLDGNNGFVLNGIFENNHSGGAVSSAGDVNGDGISDLIISATSADPGGRDKAGETYVVFGRREGFEASFELASLDGNNGFVLNGVEAGDLSGTSVADAGDVNGDGIDDIIIGTFTASPIGNNREEESYVVFGNADGFGASFELADLNGTNGFVIKGINTGDRFGRAVSGAGDVNGDGFDDLIIGAEAVKIGGEDFGGQAYLIYGGNLTGVLLTATVLTIGLNAGGQFEMQFVGVSGVEYVVENSIDLITWTPVTTIIATANSRYVVDVGAVGETRRFYRVRSLNGE